MCFTLTKKTSLLIYFKRAEPAFLLFNLKERWQIFGTGSGISVSEFKKMDLSGADSDYSHIFSIIAVADPG